MKRVVTFMTERFAPRMTRFTRNVWVRSIQESMMTVLPLVLVGSLVTLLGILREYVGWLPDFTGINTFTFGLIGLAIAFLVPYFVMEHKKHRDRRLLGGVTGVAVFLYLLGPTFDGDGNIALVAERLGPAGIFVGVVAGIFVGLVLAAFTRLSFFKNSTSMPDFVILWFDSLLPIITCVTTAWLLIDIANVDFFGALADVLSPLGDIAQSFGGFVLIYFLCCFLYSFGLSPWVLFPVVYPLQLQGIQDNVAAAAAGGAPHNINTWEVIYSGWVAFGGIGATLPLVLMMAFGARSVRLKAVGRAALVPSLFNINEPVVFGAPIAFNPLLMIPMWISGIVPPAIVYAALSWGLADVPARVFQLWYTPFPISTWIVSPGFSSLVLFAVVFALVSAIWFPFFKAYDIQALAEDSDDEYGRVEVSA